ncbi:hypothetical protein B0I35DRAFT_481274 [Stachybotrys elegans]|uniref:EthD domain-containing protein n=1 Tax=Stachybotrys elegans TaxID=80388 RepID=A0A8K0WMX5_9HYPO|nr:hypothetical protein B0I35DRAFT_481274 [Stachybotrys elegans]
MSTSASAAESTSGRLVRITILVRKLDNISYEEFHDYWSKKHPDIWLSVPIVQEKIIKYSQFHGDNSLRAAYGSHVPFASYDGAAEMWAASVEDLLELGNSQMRIEKVPNVSLQIINIDNVEAFDS